MQFSVQARVDRTKALEVEVHVMSGMNYDEAVDAAKSASDDNGWIFIQDVTLDGYKDTPKDILRGYSTLVTEMWKDLSATEAPTHIFLQVGAGLFASGMVNAMVAQAKASAIAMPKVVAVEARGTTTK